MGKFILAPIENTKTITIPDDVTNWQELLQAAYDKGFSEGKRIQKIEDSKFPVNNHHTRCSWKSCTGDCYERYS